MNEQQSLTVGSVPKKMLLFAIPVFFSNLFQQLYNAADSLIVGNFLGEQALAAVGSSGSLIMLMTGFISGMALGAGVLIARMFGANDADGMERTVHTTAALGLCGGAVLTVVGIVFTPQILLWMGTPSDVLAWSTLYFRVYFIGCIPVILYNMAASILQSVGDSKSPMKYLITASVINVVLDLFFVGVLRMDVSGAALATIISQTVSAALALGKLCRVDAPYRLYLRQIRFDRATLGEVVRLGVPSGVQNSVISLANVVVQANINAFGSAAMAGCGAYSKLEGFAFLPVSCFALALSTFISQNIGARRYDRARSAMRFGLICSPLLAEVVGLAIFTFAPVLIAAFNNQPEVLSFGVNNARTVSLFYFLLAFAHCCAGILRGMGRPIVPMAIMLSIWCVLRITYITITVRLIPSIRVIYWAYPLTWAISCVLFILCLTKLKFPPMERAGEHISGESTP